MQPLPDSPLYIYRSNEGKIRSFFGTSFLEREREREGGLIDHREKTFITDEESFLMRNFFSFPRNTPNLLNLSGGVECYFCSTDVKKKKNEKKETLEAVTVEDSGWPSRVEIQNAGIIMSLV